MTTNADKIRSMSDEELAEYHKTLIGACFYCPVKCKNPHINQKKRCLNSIIKYYKQEAKD